MKSVSKPKNVIVVGMPRSGTSMTSSIFANCGYFVTENNDTELRASDEYNPTGYWEADSLIKSNAEIFTAAGYPHDNTWLYSSISSEQAQKISKLKPTIEHINLVQKYNNNRPWLWKDPRLCYTLPYWWPLFDSDSTKVLFLKRDPKEIYNSFTRLKWRTGSTEDKNDVYTRIDNHMAAVESALKTYKIPHIVINYSDYKEHDDETAKKLSRFFGVDLKKEDLGYQQKYNSYSLQGIILRVVDKAGDLLPDSTRTFLKKLIPVFIWKLINPHRYSK